MIIGSILTFTPLSNTTAINYGSDTDLFDADNRITGEDSFDEAGTSVSLSPDINGDGIDDILIGAELFDSFGLVNNGKTYVLFGSKSGWAMDKHLTDSPFSFAGGYSYDRAGVITPAGDVNRDGLCDILIGAPYNDSGGSLLTHPTDGNGQVYLFFGRTTGFEPNFPLSQADASFIGEEPYDNVGYHISSAGDINGDGFDDILIGTPNSDSGGLDAGKVYLIFGKQTGWKRLTDLSHADVILRGEKAGDQLHTVTNAGDVNHDGYDDILLGASHNDDGGSDSGKIYLILGRISSKWETNVTVDTVADASFLGEKADDHLSKVAGVKDVNDDSFDDILIGAPDNNEGGVSAGKSYLIFGKKESWKKDIDLSSASASFIGENAGDKASSVAGVGDVNGDGFNDFIIGATYNDEGSAEAGQVYLFLGKSTGWTTETEIKKADASFLSNHEDGKIGLLKGGYHPGDVNGDGYDDLIIGEPGNSEYGIKQGLSYLFFIEINQRPVNINDLSIYTDSKYTQSMNQAELNETVFIEIKGDDSDHKRRNMAEVHVATKYDPNGIKVRLLETDNNSGIFRGLAIVSSITQQSHNWIGSNENDVLILTSVENPLIVKKIPIGPRIKIEYLALIDGDGPNGKTIYNERKTYTLQVVLNSSLGCEDVKSVILNWYVEEKLDAKSTSKFDELKGPVHPVSVRWSSSDDNFEILNAPESWLELVEPVSDCYLDEKIIELYFNLNFKWSYSSNITTKISVQSLSFSGRSYWSNYTRSNSNIFFRTVNDVHLIGNLSVSGNLQGELIEGDIVLSNEILTWTGISAVYIDSYNPDVVFASPGSLQVQLMDSLGSIWKSDVSLRENITIDTVVPDKNEFENVYKFTLINIPVFCDHTDISFVLNVVNAKPKKPLNLIIHADSIDDDNHFADNDNDVYLTWDEPENHPYGIVGYYYSFDNNELTTNGSWTDKTQGKIRLSDDFGEVKDGKINVYVWAVDEYGSSGYAAKASIIIDTQPVKFIDAKPAPDFCFGSTEVQVSIVISDIGGSGVDGATIYYSKSTTGIDGYGAWIPYDQDVHGTMIICSITTLFADCSDNYIKWRAKDLAGNGYTESPDINVKIDTGLKNRAPTVSLQSPENDSIVTTEFPILYWKGTDIDGDSLSYDVYFSTNHSKVTSLDSSVRYADLPATQFTSSMPLKDGETYYWTVIPFDGDTVGICLMEIWSFHIDISLRSSATRLLLPHDNSIISTLKPTLMWTVDYEGTEEVTITYDVYLDTKPNPTKIVSANQLENSFQPILPLTNGETYYWKVIPYANSIKGTCISGVWRFNIDLDFSYEINLNSEFSQLSLEQGDFKSINLFISNKGNQPDTIKLYSSSEKLEDLTFNETTVLLPRYDKATAILYIHIPKNIDKGTYTITVKAVSEGARVQGQDIRDEAIITIKVLESSESKEKEELMNAITILVGFIILLNVILGFTIVILRRIKQDKELYKNKYYIHKYSKLKSSNKQNGRIRRTSRIKQTDPYEGDLEPKISLKTEFSKAKEQSYTYSERMAILKYLRHIGRITDSQYKKGMSSLKAWSDPKLKKDDELKPKDIEKNNEFDSK